MRGYRADTAFDGERRLAGGVLVLVEDSSIVGIEPGSAVAPAGCEVTHFPGTTLLPGLIDTHVHLCGDSSPRALDRLPGLSPSELEDAIEAAKRRTLAVGVTSVRDLGDQEWAVVDRHRGAGDGPTVVASGPPITSLRGHCWSMGGEAAGTAALRQAVRDRSDRGADIVKIMASGGVLTPGTDVLACQFSMEELRAVVEEAHDVGLGVTAHAHGLPAVEQCVAAEVDGIEHCSCLVTGGFRTPPELAAALAAAGTAVCPTLGVASGVEPPPQLKALMEATGATVEGRRAHFGKLYRAGVTLISGGGFGYQPRQAARDPAERRRRPHRLWRPDRRCADLGNQSRRLGVRTRGADRAAARRSRRGPADRGRRSTARHRGADPGPKSRLPRSRRRHCLTLRLAGHRPARAECVDADLLGQ